MGKRVIYARLKIRFRELSNEETEIQDPWSSVARLYLYLFTYVWVP